MEGEYTEGALLHQQAAQTEPGGSAKPENELRKQRAKALKGREHPCPCSTKTTLGTGGRDLLSGKKRKPKQKYSKVLFWKLLPVPGHLHRQ